MIVFFFNDTATTEIYTLSLHDALPIYPCRGANSQRTISRVSSARRSSHRCSGATWNSPTRRFRCESSGTTPAIGVSSPASPSGSCLKAAITVRSTRKRASVSAKHPRRPHHLGWVLCNHQRGSAVTELWIHAHEPSLHRLSGLSL